MVPIVHDGPCLKIRHRRETTNNQPVVGLRYFFVTTIGIKKKCETDYAKDESGQSELDTEREKVVSLSTA